MLALFRAQGGRIPHNQLGKSSVKSKKINYSKKEKLVDIFDPVNHQRLPVIFYSFCPESNNAPSFCVEPRFIILLIIYNYFLHCMDNILLNLL